MKSAGEASSTFTASSSLIRTSARSSSSCNEGVIARMGCVSVPASEQLVQAKFRRRERLRHVEAETAEPRCADRDEQRLERLDPLLEVVEPALDELRTRQSL